MKTLMKMALVFSLLVCTGIGYGSVTRSGDVILDVAMDKPILLADSQQTAYLRIGLEGVKVIRPEKRASVNIAIVIDKSGSMTGEKISKAKEAAIMAIRRLGANDIVSVVVYDSGVNVIVPATKASDKEDIFQAIRNIEAGGSTALYDGVRKGAAQLRKFIRHERGNRLVLLSDGLANVGPDSPQELGKLGKQLIKEGISVTTIGLGLSYNEDLMMRLAYNSDGNHYFAKRASDLEEIFDDEFGKVMCVVAQEIQTKIKLGKGVRPVRFLGREGKIHGQQASVFINQIYSKNEKVIVLEVEVEPTEMGQVRQLAVVDVSFGDTQTEKAKKLKSIVEVNFTNSKELVAKNTNEKVMVDVIELIATEKNEKALELRDKGKIKESRDILVNNEAFLKSNAARYNSPRLKIYADTQAEDYSNLDEKNWARQRKSMREGQYKNKMKQ